MADSKKPSSGGNAGGKSPRPEKIIKNDSGSGANSGTTTSSGKTTKRGKPN